MDTHDWMVHAGDGGQANANTLASPPRSDWNGMPPPPPRPFRADAPPPPPPPRSPWADAPTGVFGRMAAYWGRMSPRRRLVVILVALALIAAIAGRGHIGSVGASNTPTPTPAGSFSPVAIADFNSQCESDPTSQSVCGCALNYLEQTMPPSLFNVAMTGPQTTKYESYFNDAYSSCGV